VLMGVEYKEYDWKNKGVDLDASGDEDNSTFASNKADLYTTGVFTEVQYRPCTFFKLLAGIRYEDHSEFGSENLPRFGLIFNPLEDTAVKMTHGKHFLAPTPNDLFYPYEDWGWGMGAEGNLDLKPEIGWHSDITVEQALLDNKIFLTGAYFNWDMDDRILWADDGTGFWRPENLKSYEAQGFELGSSVGPYYNMTVHLNYTYLDAEEEGEEYSKVTPGDQKTWKKHRATYSPEHLFKGVLVYQAPFNMTASLTLRYVNERVWYRNESDDYVNYKTVVYELDAYTTADIKIEQRLYDNWLLSLQGNNLFDEEYDTYFSTFTDPNTFETLLAGYPGAGQSIFFSVSYQY
jgi:outer membrane receptor for ferrienterochelin and colicin